MIEPLNIKRCIRVCSVTLLLLTMVLLIPSFPKVEAELRGMSGFNVIIHEGEKAQGTFKPSSSSTNLFTDVTDRVTYSLQPGPIPSATFSPQGFRYDISDGSPTITAVLSTENLAVGNYFFTIKGVDEDGNTATSGGFVRVLAAVPPPPPDPTLANLQEQINDLSANLNSLQEALNNIELTPGPAGPAGPKGADGAAGEKGADGALGPMGPQGEKGADGALGPMGPQGEKGAAGLAGEKGDRGPQGLPGERGPQGPPGEKGAPGDACPKTIKGIFNMKNGQQELTICVPR